MHHHVRAMDSLTPSDLFSPSKARQQRAQAQDWAHIDSWLSYKYAGRTVPTFERNDETLTVLRELSAANERADEERAIRERLEREALRELERDEAARLPADKQLLDTITAHLTPSGAQSLHSLAATATALNAPTPHPETLAHLLIHHTSTAQTLTNHLAHLTTLHTYLQKQHALLRAHLSTLRTTPAFSTPPNQARHTADHARQTKHLRAKLREHEDKLAALQGQARVAAATPKSADVGSAEAIAEMLEQQKALDEWKGRVEALEEEVGEFGGLPADRDAARKEVGRLEVELDTVRRRRDALFEGLVRK
ncbi:hypothetical protein BDV95DRAFT_112407 [Massariosphaeria phaeospora]|uniref:HAUS augmin-like complex subunit 1 n=1 Tax=Massariosphaeria phaeospora TaxID=100035 RepID=A0A7C8MBM5_9PLEO|nr:hypothetical protein BDV95DRAFT_112407 [Massariosphaeria phaeospora]